MFLHEKTVDIMLKILEIEKNEERAYPLVISKEVGSPYSYISKVLSEFEENALIESEFKGRTRVVKFTDEGRKIAEMLQRLKKELGKDFITRKKISTLRDAVEVVKNEKEDTFRVLAPVKAELETIKKNVKDDETRKMVEDMEKEVNKLLR
ncbi:MAG TPA: ArsR family transcriptional regulator [Archaeoglobaceae archaeon]|nr:ArsR family transcriptional regulator [Archaeoglobaceae archaeon]